MNEMYTIADAAKILGIKYVSVYQRMKRAGIEKGKLARIGNVYILSKADIDKMKKTKDKRKKPVTEG